MSGAAASKHGPYTWDDFVRLEEDDLRELIDGELVEVEVPNAAHEVLVARLCYCLSAWAIPRDAGKVLASGYKIRITARRGIMPDVQFFARANAAQPRAVGLERGAPDLAVEIVSPSSGRYDRVTKLNYYASIGTREYWIVDHYAQTLQQLVLKDGAYSIALALEGDATFAPASFPGLEIPLAALWKEAAEAT